MIKACGSMLVSQRRSGKFLLVLHNPETKWFLKVSIDHSAELRQCTRVGTNW